MALNRIAIQGRITKDIELRYTNSGKAVTSFTLAVDRDRKDANGNRGVDFIDCTVWEKGAEFAAQYFGKGSQAVGYWWGMNSGVIDVQLSPDLPAGVRCLAECLRRDIIDHSIDPFRFPLVDQKGVEHSDGKRWLIPEEIMSMDWLLDCVDGQIPPFEKLKPAAQNVVRVLGVYRDQIPPEKEGVLL